MTRIDMTTDTLTNLIFAAGIAHFCILIASALVPLRLNWRKEFASLSRLHRQMYWVYGGYVVLSIIALGAISVINARELAAGGGLARAFCLFVAVFWGVRLSLQAVLDVKEHLTTWWLSLGYHTLTIIFTSLTILFSYAAFRPQQSDMDRSSSEIGSELKAIEIVSERVFAAPRELVYAACSQPEHLMHWWGPKGFTNTFHKFELRPGGAWEFEMLGPDGTKYPLEKRFVEVTPPERIVLDNLQPTHNFRMTMDFAEQGSQTKLTWRMVFEPVADSEKLTKFIERANEENFDRLAECLARAPR